MKKRLLSLILAFSLILSTAPTVLAADTEESTEQLEGSDDVSIPEQNAEEDTILDEGSEGAEGPEVDAKDEQADSEELLETLPVVQSADTLGSASASAGLTAVSQTHHAIANGVTYDKIVMRNKDNHQAIGYMTEIDLTKNVKLKVAYDGYYTKGSTKADRVGNAQTIRNGQWSMKETTKLAADYHCVFDSPAGDCIGRWNSHLPCCIPNGHWNYCEDAAVGRPGRRVAVSGLHDYVYEWNSAFVHWDPGTIFGKDVLRNKASSHLPCCGDE